MKKSLKIRTIILSVVAALSFVSMLSVGPTYAYLRLYAPHEVENRFTPDESRTPSISETFTVNGTSKSDVTVNVGNTGYAVYVRAAIVVTWKNGDNVLAVSPVRGTDYTLSIGDGWQSASDGFYYYRQPVDSESSYTTGVLINSCTVTGAPEESGYTLNVEIIVQTIQAEGTNESDVPAVTEAWGCTVNADKSISR